MKKLWIKLSTLGVKEEMPIETSRKVILTNQIAMASFVLLLVMNFIMSAIQLKFDLPRLLAIFTILLVLVFNKRGLYKWTGFFMATISPVCTLLFSTYNKTYLTYPLNINFYFFPLILLFSFLILPFILIESRQKILISISVSVGIISIFILEWVNKEFDVLMEAGKVSFEYYHPSIVLFIVPILIITFGFVFLNSINNKYESKILAQKDEISSINRDLTDSIVYAERIQDAVLPDTDFLPDYFTDYFIFYEAKSIVSGDFYFFKESKVQGRNCIIVAAADCTGHGVPGGFMSMLGISFLNEIIQEGKFSNAADILNQLRTNVKQALKQTGELSEQKDGMDMALCIYFPGENKLHFAGAKNPLYIISKNPEVTIYKPDRMPIGIYLKESPFTNTEIELKGGEMCYMFSDGIVDQMNNEGRKFMSKHFRQFLTEIYTKSCQQQKQLVAGRIDSWMRDENNKKVEQTDDMLLAGFRIPTSG